MREWVKCALIRAIKTTAQTMVSLLSVGYVGILDIDWVGVLSASALAGIISLLTSIGGLPEVHNPEELTEAEVLQYHIDNDDDIEETESEEIDDEEEVQ